MVSPTKTTVAQAVVAVVVLASLVSPILTTHGLPSDESRAEHFLEIAQRATEKVGELVQLADSLGYDLPEDLDSRYSEAEEFLQDAIGAFDVGEFETAFELAKEAMKASRKLYGELYEFLLDAGADLEGDGGKGLEVAIERAYTRLSRVGGILDAMEAAEMDVEDARALLDQAETHLDEALSLLGEGLVEDAAQELEEANSLIAQALASTKGAAGRFNVHRIRGLTRSLENQVQRLHRQLDSAARRLEVEDLLLQLSEVESLIEEALELAEGGDVDEAIVKLVLARETIDSIDDELRARRRGGPP